MEMMTVIIMKAKKMKIATKMFLQMTMIKNQAMILPKRKVKP
jgi:hypothetical protein